MLHRPVETAAISGHPVRRRIARRLRSRREADPFRRSGEVKRELEKGYCYAQAVKAGNTLYISGFVTWDADGNIIGEGDMKAQVAAVYTDLKETLEAHGASFQNVIKETVFTTDMEALEANNDIRTKFYEDAGSAPPASTWIRYTGLAAPELMLEVECIAPVD